MHVTRIFNYSILINLNSNQWEKEEEKGKQKLKRDQMPRFNLIIIIIKNHV